MNSARSKRPIDWVSVLDRIVERVAVLALVISGLLLVSLAAVGLWLIGSGLAVVTGVRGAMHGLSPSSEALASSLKGLEFVFLSPLPYLFLLGVYREVSGSLGDPSRGRLTQVKGLMINLMVSVIATDLVARAIANAEITYETAISRCLAIGTLAIYGWMSDRHPASASP